MDVQKVYPVAVRVSSPCYQQFEAAVHRCVLSALHLEKAPKEREVALLLVDDRQISDYHDRFLGIATPTDVLSWESDEGLGDVMVSCETAYTQARTLGHSWEREVCVLAVHGVLHLLGWDDQTHEDQQAMQERVDRIVDTCLS